MFFEQARWIRLLGGLGILSQLLFSSADRTGNPENYWQGIHIPFSALKDRFLNCNRDKTYALACARALDTLVEKSALANAAWEMDEEGRITLVSETKNLLRHTETLQEQLPKSKAKLAHMDFAGALTAWSQSPGSRISSSYLIGSALNAWLTAFDPHSNLLPASLAEEQASSSDEEVSGIGAKIRKYKGEFYVAYVQEGSSAESAGLEAGDRIVMVNGRPASSYLRDRRLPQKASSYELLVDRGGKPVFLSSLPKHSWLKNVETRRLTGSRGESIGLIKVRSFTKDDTCESIATALHGWEKEKLDAVVMDLRNNAGGLVREALCTTGLFVGPGKLVARFRKIRDAGLLPGTAVGASHSGDFELVTKRRQLTRLPLLILINQNTASAAEILSAALQDMGRARLIGTRSFGKGAMQSVFHPWSDPSLFFVTTTHKIYRPSGESFQKKGVEPDLSTEERQKPGILREIDLFANAIPGDLSNKLRGFGEAAPKKLSALLRSKCLDTEEAARIRSAKDKELSLAKEALQCL